MTLKIWTDGSVEPNPGIGGWAYTRSDGKEEFGGEVDVTNNRMEMTAILKALQSLEKDQHAIILSDSQYCIKGMNEWRKGWKRKNWTRGKEPLANADLWQLLDAEANSKLNVSFQWVRGHNGDPGNERADDLAGQGRYQMEIAQ